MESKLSETKALDTKLTELASKVADRRAVTLDIHHTLLPFYLNAALAANFKVEKADEGKEWPYLSADKYNTDGTRKVEFKKVQSMQFSEGYIAICIEKPEGSKEDHTPFWKELENNDAYKEAFGRILT